MEAAVDPQPTVPARPPLLPSVLMGIGFGGFVDGIVLHQILQWHHLLSSEGCCPPSTIAGIEDNVLADGFFHVATWIALFAGTIIATRAWQRGELGPPWRRHCGGMLLGWGGFNLVEGLVNHHLLGLHHVRDDLGAPLGWDLAFLASGALLAAAGWALTRSSRTLTPSANQSRRPSG